MCVFAKAFVHRCVLHSQRVSGVLSPMTDTPNIAQLERLLSEYDGHGRLPESVEKTYLDHVHTVRAKVMRLAAVPSVIVYNAFLVADYLLVPETFRIALLLHLCVVTPVMILVGIFYGRMRSHALRSAAVMSIPVLIVMQIMTIFIMNSGTGAEHYQYLAIPVLVYINVTLRGEYRLAVAVSAVLVAIYLAVLLTSSIAWQAKTVGMWVMIGVTHMTLLANHWMNRDSRRTFVRQLYEGLMRENAENRAHRDPLTGIANRHQLEKMAADMRDNSEAVSPVAVIMIDIDHFKAFNDRFGHPAGDECLKRVANTLAECVEGDELVARYGGEEFIAVLPRTVLPDAARRAELIRRAVSEIAIPHPGAGIGGVVTASLGVMAGPMSSHELSELIAGADAALYAAKRAGRNTVWPPFLKERGQVVSVLPAGLNAK